MRVCRRLKPAWQADPSLERPSDDDDLEFDWELYELERESEADWEAESADGDS